MTSSLMRGRTIVWAALLAVALLGSGAVVAQDGEETPDGDGDAQAAEPAEPAPTREYSTPDEVLGAARALAEDSADATVEILGTSGQGREVIAIHVNAPGGDARRPTLLVVGGVRGTDRAGPECALHLLERLLDPDDADARAALEHAAVTIVPVLNPDGLAHTLGVGGGARVEHEPNLVPVDEDHDGRTDEDAPDDLNGDGMITVMRVPDAAGDWIEADSDDPETPARMRRVDRNKGETGTHRILTEGRDDDGDGRWNEDGPGGIRYDRHFPADHVEWPEQSHAGTWPVQDPVARGFVEMLLARPEVVAVLEFAPSLDGRGGVLLHPPAWDDPRGLNGDDRAVFNSLKDAWKEAGGHDVSAARGHDREPGTLLDWAYAHRGLWALRSVPWREPGEDWTAPAVPWTPVEVEGLEGAEVGGFKPLARMAPPAGEALGAVVTGQADFALALLDRLPRIELDADRTETRRLGPRTYEFRLSVRNAGGMPTWPSTGNRARGDFRIHLTVDEEAVGGRVVMGDARLSFGRLAAGEAAELKRWVMVFDKEPPPGSTMDVHLHTPGEGARTLTLTVRDKEDR